MVFPPITDNSGLKEGNETLEEFMTTTFTLFETHSAAARQFFATAINPTHDVKVAIEKGGTATGGAAVGTNVTMDTSKCVFTATRQRKPDGAKELVESTIFEIQNAINSAQRGALDTQFLAGTLALRQYGTQYAEIESESTWIVSKILQEVGTNYDPSDWGRDQIDETSGHTVLQTFTPAFVIAPHSSSPRAHGTKFSLPSGEMYAYQKINELKSYQKIEAALIKAAVITKTGSPGKGTKEVMEKIKSRTSAPPFSNLRFGQPQLTIFYHVVIELFKHLATQQGWQVVWGAGAGAADWEFSTAMKALAADSNGALAHLQQNIALLAP